MSAPRGNRVAWCRLFAAGAALSGCFSQHEAQGSDTATNWLARCERHSDCHGMASCLSEVCTLPCSVDDAEACSSLSPSASCEAGRTSVALCDQSCASDDACTSLGSDYRCTAGACRPGTGASSGSLERAQLPNDVITLSDVEVSAASAPAVEWRNDHWTVTWLGGIAGWTEKYPEPRGVPTRTVEARLNVVQIDAKGSQRARSTAFANHLENVVQGGAGKVALFAANPWSADLLVLDPCAFSLVDTATLQISSVHNFDCPSGARGAVAPVPDSDDWLLVWSTTPTGKSGDVMLARYRPGDSGFRAGPWSIATQRPSGAFSIAALGGDAWLAWPEAGGTTYARVPQVAQPSVQKSAGNPVVGTSSTPISTARYAFAPTQTGAQLAYATTTSLQSIAVDNAAPESAQESALSTTQLTNGTSSGIELAALRIPERGVTVVCYPQSVPEDSTGTTMAIITIGDDGRRASNPALGDIAWQQGCSMAWSGSALLVAWWERDIANSGSAYSVIRARIVELP